MPPVLRFVRCLEDNVQEKDLALLDQAFKSAAEHDIPCKVIKKQDDLKSLPNNAYGNDKSIFVCFPFKGVIYDLLTKKSIRIIGPQCVLSCLLMEISVPKRTDPLCNVSMLGVVVCCSSIKKEKRKVIHELVQMMAGNITFDFTSNVTHLIAQEVGSKKYQVACSNKIPCMLPSWVHTMWKRSQYEHIVAKDDDFSEHLVPIFKGCTICVSGMTVEQRNDIKDLVGNNGGTYSAELNMKTCTHLLTNNPKGKKYIFAKQWKLHCITLNWLYDCLKKGHWQDEAPYVLNTKQNDEMSNSSIDNTKVSNIVDESVVPNSTLLQNSKMNDKKTHSVNDLTFKSFSLETITLDDLKFAGETGSCYFDGFKIFLSNSIKGALFDCCRQIINNSGGFWLNKLTTSITHIICTSPDTELMKYLTEVKDCPAFVLNPLWLIESAKKNIALPEEDFSLLVNDENEDINTTTSDKPAPSLNSSNLNPSTTSISAVFAADKDDLINEEEFLSQYLPDNCESTRCSQVELPQKEAERLPSVEKGEMNHTEDNEDTAILRKKHFIVQRYDDAHTQSIKALIIEYAGLITNDLASCDYIIVPLTFSKKGESHPKEVTVCWLEQCIDAATLFPTNQSFLYKPLYLPDGCKPLKSCVVTVSQYTGMERQHLMHLAELLGAVAQDYFARKDSDTIKACSHLILKSPEGVKYSASLKWGIPCVNADWLFQCARNRKRLCEGNFDLNKTNPEAVTHEVTPDNVEDLEGSVSIGKEMPSESTIKENASSNFDFGELSTLDAIDVDTNKKTSLSSTCPNNNVFSGQKLKFDFYDVLSSIPSPAPRLRQRQSRTSLPFEVRFADAMQKAINKHIPEADRNIEKKNVSLPDAPAVVTPTPTPGCSNEEPSLPDVFQRKMEKIMEISKVKESRRPRRMASHGSIERKVKTPSQNKIAQSADRKIDIGHSEHSQSDCITYDDPKGREERLRILAQLKLADCSQDINTVPEHAPETEPSPSHIFMISGMTSKEKATYGATIEKLGGVLLNKQNFDENCTHVVLSNLTKNEKYLASLASGKWILRKSYLEASSEAGSFIDESGHEWSGDTCTAKTCRMRLKNGSPRVFSEWRVLLCLEASKLPSFKRILETGGAQVLAVQPPYDTYRNATHLFFNDHEKVSGLITQQLTSNGTLVLKAEYISDFLTLNTCPPVRNYALKTREARKSTKRAAAEHALQQANKRVK